MVRLTASRTALKVTELLEKHEFHRTGEEEYILYPEVKRRIPDPQVDADVDLLIAANVIPSRIRSLLKDVNSGILDPRVLANRRCVFLLFS